MYIIYHTAIRSASISIEFIAVPKLTTCLLDWDTTTPPAKHLKLVRDAENNRAYSSTRSWTRYAQWPPRGQNREGNLGLIGADTVSLVYLIHCLFEGAYCKTRHLKLTTATSWHRMKPKTEYILTVVVVVGYSSIAYYCACMHRHAFILRRSTVNHLAW